MQAENLKGWLAVARNKEREESTAGEEMMEGNMGGSTEPTEVSNWERVVGLVHKVFREGRLADEATWQAVVLIPKGEKDYCGIGLVEVMWKVVAEILK